MPSWGRGHEWAGDYDLWVANYTAAPQPALPYPWQTWHIWQYDSKPNVLQSMHALDVNRFNGDVDALKAWAASYKKADGSKAVALRQGRAGAVYAGHSRAGA